MTCRFRCRPTSDSPAPRPVVCSAGRCKSAAATAPAVVVLPIPISPVPSSVYPCSFNVPTRRIPVSMAWITCARLMAGSLVKSFVPFPIRQDNMARACTASRMPISTAYTSVPLSAHIRLTLAFPDAILSATRAVTWLPVCVTPWAVTPLSAQNTSMARLRIAISAVPWIPAILTSISSSLPRPCKGLATLSHCARACATARSSAGLPYNSYG